MQTYFNEQSHIDILWDKGYTGKRVKVGIVDTGILASDITKIKKNIVCGHNFSLDGSGRNNITSSTYHGFAVASLVLGVAPKAKLVIAKVLNDEGMGDPKRTAQGIRYCINKKCHIINCSIAGPHDPDLEAAINEAYSKGITVVGATGNNGRNMLLYPASYLNCIGVGACDENNKPTEFSNYNVFMDLIALGDNIEISTKDGIIIDSGTSFSAPLVTGTLALLREQFKSKNNRSPNCDELKYLLLGNCVLDYNADRLKQGNGCLNYKGGIKE